MYCTCSYQLLSYLIVDTPNKQGSPIAVYPQLTVLFVFTLVTESVYVLVLLYKQ